MSGYTTHDGFNDSGMAPAATDNQICPHACCVVEDGFTCGVAALNDIVGFDIHAMACQVGRDFSARDMMDILGANFDQLDTLCRCKDRQRIMDGPAGLWAAIPGDEDIGANIGEITMPGDRQNRFGRRQNKVICQVQRRAKWYIFTCALASTTMSV